MFAIARNNWRPSALDTVRVAFDGKQALQIADRLIASGAIDVVAIFATLFGSATSLGLGALQIWQALSEGAGRGRGDRPVAILLTDLVRAVLVGGAGAVRARWAVSVRHHQRRGYFQRPRRHPLSHQPRRRPWW